MGSDAERHFDQGWEAKEKEKGTEFESENPNWPRQLHAIGQQPLLSLHIATATAAACLSSVSELTLNKNFARSRLDKQTADSLILKLKGCNTSRATKLVPVPGHFLKPLGQIEISSFFWPKGFRSLQVVGTSYKSRPSDPILCHFVWTGVDTRTYFLILIILIYWHYFIITSTKGTSIIIFFIRILFKLYLCIYCVISIWAAGF